MGLTQPPCLSALEECANLLAGEEGKQGKTPACLPNSRCDGTAMLYGQTQGGNAPGTSSAPAKIAGHRDKRKFSKFNSPKKSKEKIAKLRAEGHCFKCESTESMSKDCPKRINKRPPIHLANAELVSPAKARLAAMEEGSALELFNIQHGTENCSSDRELHHAALWYWAVQTLQAAVPLTFDYVGDDADESPFMVD